MKSEAKIRERVGRLRERAEKSRTDVAELWVEIFTLEWALSDGEDDDHE